MWHYGYTSAMLVLDLSSRKIVSQRAICCQYNKYKFEIAKVIKKQFRSQEAQIKYIRELRKYKVYIVSSKSSVYP